MRAIVFFMLVTGVAGPQSPSVTSPENTITVQSTPASPPLGAQATTHDSLVTAQLALDVSKCAWTPPTTTDELKTVTAPTIVTAYFSSGIATKVEVSLTSGNPKLDDRVTRCVRNLPKDKVSLLPQGQMVVVPVHWSRPTNTITVQSHVSPLPPPHSLISAPLGISPHSCADAYPPLSIWMGQEGKTTVMLDVTAQGAVADARVQRSSGHDALDQAAVACAKQWTYRPAMQNGVPVEARTLALIIWKLNEPPPPPMETLAGPPGWLPLVSQSPNVIAMFKIPDSGNTFPQTVTAEVHSNYATLDTYIAKSRALLQSNSGVMLMSETSTTVCDGEPAWQVIFAVPGSRAPETERVATVKDGHVYVASYVFVAVEPMRPEAIKWIHEFCERAR